MFGVSLGNLVINLGMNASAMERTLQTAEKHLSDASKRMESTGRKMSMSLTAPLMGVGYWAVKNFASFDDAMTQSTAIMVTHDCS